MTKEEALKWLDTIMTQGEQVDALEMAIESLESQKSIVEELEKIKAEVKEIRMEEPLMSKGFECYGFKDKTPVDIKIEVIELLEEHISELKGSD